MTVENKGCSPNVLMLLNNHFTHDARVLKEGRSLINKGYNVTLKCYWDEGLERAETIEDIKVERVLYTSRQFTKSFFIKIILFIKFVQRSLKDAYKFNVIHCHDLIMLGAGVIIKILSFGKHKLIYDAHEYHAERKYKSQLRKKFVKVSERFLIRFADAVITVSNGIADEYARLYDIKRPYVVLNCPSFKQQQKRNIFREKFNLSDDQMIFLYQGNFGKNRGIESILNIFMNYNHDNNVLICMGYGMLEDFVKNAAGKHDNIFFHEAVGQDVLLEYTSSADVGFCFIENSCLSYYYCTPNKFFEYTMAGLSVIASDLFELSRLIDKHDNGYLVTNGSVEDLHKCIETIDRESIAGKRENAMKMRQEFSWEEQEKILFQVYENLF